MMQYSPDDTVFTGYPEGPKTYLWNIHTMPDAQPNQIAATTEEANSPDFNPNENRIAHIQWYQPPKKANKKDVCMVIISGGGYECCCDIPGFAPVAKRFQEEGLVCVKLTYRSPRPTGIPIYKTAWEDGQRGIRFIRAAAAEHGFDPEKICIIGCSAGSHLCMLLALSSQTASYAPVDDMDAIPCHVNAAVPTSVAYVISDGLTGPNTHGGHGDDAIIDPVFAFDEKTCPICFIQGGDDPYSAMGSLKSYCRLRRMGLPAELHLEAYGVHGFMHLKRYDTAQLSLDFLRRTTTLLSGTPSTPGENRPAAEQIQIALDWEREQIAGHQVDLHIC